MNGKSCPFVDGNCTEECQAFMADATPEVGPTCSIVRGISNISLSLILICRALRLGVEEKQEEYTQ